MNEERKQKKLEELTYKLSMDPEVIAKREAEAAERLLEEEEAEKQRKEEERQKRLEDERLKAEEVEAERLKAEEDKRQLESESIQTAEPTSSPDNLNTIEDQTPSTEPAATPSEPVLEPNIENQPTT